MKNEYVGDAGDFGKYLLLKKLQEIHTRLGVVWYLTPDVSNGDGEKVQYLKNKKDRSLIDPCDYELAGRLEAIIASWEMYRRDDQMDRMRQVRSVQSVQQLGILDPIGPAKPKPLFFENILPKREDARKAWFDDALSTLADCDLVFVDPDNGLVPPKGRVGEKYATWDEIAAFHDSGRRTVIVYQHCSKHEPEAATAERLVTECRRRGISAMPIGPLRFGFHGVRLFLVIPADRMYAPIRAVIDQLVSGPAGHPRLFRLHDVKSPRASDSVNIPENPAFADAMSQVLYRLFVMMRSHDLDGMDLQRFTRIVGDAFHNWPKLMGPAGGKLDTQRKEVPLFHYRNMLSRLDREIECMKTQEGKKTTQAIVALIETEFRKAGFDLRVEPT